MHTTSDGSNGLCLDCGLCCSGALFADVQLQEDDDPARLESLGLPLTLSRGCRGQKLKFPQPCIAFAAGRCGIYADRPVYCREFECLLLKEANAGRIEVAAARRVIQATRRNVRKVERLLRQLGDTDETVALSKRFRRVRTRMEALGSGDGTTRLFGELTLAFHELTVRLSERFYPGN